MRSWSCDHFCCVCNFHIRALFGGNYVVEVVCFYFLWEKYLYWAETTHLKAGSVTCLTLICNNNNLIITFISNDCAICFFSFNHVLCVPLSLVTLMCVHDWRKHTVHICHIDARHAEERGSSHFPLQRRLFITALVSLTVMQSEQFLCIWVYYSHISHIQVKPHSWVLTQCCTVKSTFSVCLVWSPWSVLYSSLLILII